MLNVANLLDIKGRAVFSAVPHTTTLEALRLMAEKGVGALVVLEGGKLVGIISERDFARQIARKGTCNLEEPVSALMTTRIFTVQPSNTIEECMAIMTEHRVRHLPVLDGGTLVGVISIGDVVRELIADRELLIRNLENYIMGTGYIR